MVSFSQDLEGWTLKKEKDGVKVYLKKNEETGIYDVRLVFVTQASMDQILTVLRNPGNFSSWVYNCKEAKSLEMMEDNKCIYYSRIDFPWPLSDRDLVVHSTLKHQTSSGKAFIRSIAITDHLPETHKVVRVTKMESLWEITPLAEGGIRMDYQMSSDPAGSIPTWLINMAVDKGPIQTVKALREEINQVPVTPALAASGDN